MRVRADRSSVSFRAESRELRAPSALRPSFDYYSRLRNAAARRRGVTLIELVVVMMILVALAGLVITRVNPFFADPDENDQALEAWRNMTLLNLTAARKAVLGDPSRVDPNGFLADVGRIPTKLSELFVKPEGAPDFTPSTGRGWRGPYLVGATGTYRTSMFNDLTMIYGKDGDLALLDAWTFPIVVQIPDPNGDGVISAADKLHARLVSAGPNKVLDTPRTNPPGVLPEYAHFPPVSDCGDDLVLYLRTADLRLE